jgi:hypothetical protein
MNNGNAAVNAMLAFKNFVKPLVPKKLFGAANELYVKTMLTPQLKEKKVSYGNEHPDKTFYIVRRLPPGAGLFANVQYAFGYIIYAIQKGYIPIVDMENYKTCFNCADEINGTMNAWEYYFEQPAGYTLRDIQKAKNVILGSFFDAPPNIGSLLKNQNSAWDDKERVVEENALYVKYIRYKPHVLQYAAETQQAVFGGKKNIMGVKARGSDVFALHIPGHAKIPVGDQWLSFVDDCFIKWKMDYIYLAVEDEALSKIFKNYYGDKLIMTNIPRITETNNKQSAAVSFGREHDEYLKGLEYITDILLLANCDSLIGSMNCGPYYALIHNNNRYSNKYMIDLGRF